MSKLNFQSVDKGLLEAMEVAIRDGNFDFVQKTLEGFENVNDKASLILSEISDGNTLLHLACGKDHSIAKLLIGNLDGNDIVSQVNTKNLAGQTPLHIAAQTSRRKTLSLELCKAGADLQAPDSKGKTPYQMLHGVDPEFAQELRKSAELADFSALTTKVERLEASRATVSAYRKSSASMTSAASHVSRSSQARASSWVESVSQPRGQGHEQGRGK